VSSKDSVNSFGARDTLKVGDKSYQIYRLDAVAGTEKLPYSLKVLAENLLRTEDGANITKDHIEAIANWDPSAEPSVEIQFTPARDHAGLLGVPASSTSPRCGRRSATSARPRR
jgi:aconitate hydratase